MFDTSVLVAGQIQRHVHHATAWPWLNVAQQGTFKLIVAAHSMAECYAILTTLPKPARIRPVTAAKMLETNVLPFATVTPLLPDDYWSVITQLAADGLVGGIVYDALGVKAAQLAHADRLLTFNLKHFRRLWPEGHDKIISPEHVAPSDLVPPQPPTED
jgi:predicted nucleic acid-binding protein